MENTEKVSVFNTVTKKYEKVEVSKEVAAAYKRTGWNIDDNDKSFFKHETQFSQLIGGQDNAFENFSEFIDEENIPEKILEKRERYINLYWALSLLEPEERLIIEEMYFKNKTQQDIFIEYGIKQTTVSYRKRKIIKKLKKLLMD